MMFFGVLQVETLTEYQECTVYIDPLTSAVSYKFGAMDKLHGTASGYFNNTLNVTGWSLLEVQTTGRQVKNTDLMFAAGFLEGVLTAREIWQNFLNIKDAVIGKNSSSMSKLRDFFMKQDKWMRSMIDSHPADEDSLWRHVSYILAQFDGLYSGYKAVAKPDWDTDVFVIQLLNGIGDFLDIQHVVEPTTRPDFTKMTKSQFEQFITSAGHCSALVKVTNGFENLFMSHSSWFIYASTMRIYKHYHFDINDPDTRTLSLSFSSYPGFIESLDDFYLLGSKLVVLQTTNNIFNISLYDLVKPESLLAWQRVRVANMMADSGQSWFSALKLYNSGTYNNQYMVIDLKRVELNKSVSDGTLWVVEQIPGLVVGADQTSILRAGYWPSYNVPFYETIYNMSGYPDIVTRRGLEYSYQLAPRAKIFRREQGSVVNLSSMQSIMRYNDYEHDIYSEDNPCNTICCRNDLRKTNASASGCYDTKVSDYKMAVEMSSVIINGPTTSHHLKPFCWSSGPFVNSSHVGLPDVYDFDWVFTRPQL
jgi:hypothetical protein